MTGVDYWVLTALIHIVYTSWGLVSKGTGNICIVINNNPGYG